MLLCVFSASPSLPVRSGSVPLFQQSSLLLRWVSKTRTREASFLLYCTLKPHPVAPRSLLVPSAVTGHRRPQALLKGLSLWCLSGSLSALQPHSAPPLSWLKPTGGSRHVKHLVLDIAKQRGFHGGFANILYFALPSTNAAASFIITSRLNNASQI